jgi:hypothetical protein
MAGMGMDWKLARVEAGLEGVLDELRPRVRCLLQISRITGMIKGRREVFFWM